MSKYSYEFKLQVINYYLQEHHSYSECCKKFNIPSKTPITKWVERYKLFGTEGITDNYKSNYDGEFKKNVVEYMQSNHLSATETANYFKLSSATVVLDWKRIYYEEGPQSLFLKPGDRSKNMSLKRKSKNENKKENDELLKELEYLRMENEYLKKLNALVQERVKRENKTK